MEENKNEENINPNKFHHKKRDFIESIRKNPWILATLVLVILLSFFLIKMILPSGFTGKVISSNEAGKKLLDFYSSMGVKNLTLKSVKEKSGLYEVTVIYQNQEVPLYITKDGKNVIESMIPTSILSDNNTASSSSSTSSSSTQEIPKSEKPSIELFVMSYCPYGTQAEKGIIPAIELLNNTIDFKLRFVYYAMHPSQGEVEENLRQYCIQKEEPQKLISYLKCFLKEGNSQTCLTENKIDKSKLDSCTKSADTEFEISKNKNDKSSWLSGSFPLFNIDKALNEKYGVQGSPTLVINGKQVSSSRDPQSYLDVICKAFTTTPEICSTKLSTSSYSPGFGYDSTTSTNTAQCS